LFAPLQSLGPVSGARTLLRDANWEASAFPLPEAAVDIDTPEEFPNVS